MKYSEKPPLYEMCSWPDGEGGWNFRVLKGSPDAGWFPDKIFDAELTLHGLDELKWKISELPSGANVWWFEYTSYHIPATESLAYPPDEVMAEVKLYAAERGIRINS